MFGKFLRALFGIKTARAAAAAAVVGAGIYGGFELSQRSLDTLHYVSPEMQEVTQCASKQPITLNGKQVTFVVYHGLRSEEEQRTMLARGVSWVNRSRHQDGHAVDVMAVVDGKSTWEHPPYYEIARAFYKCGEKLGKPITWGGEWHVKDMVHFELKDF